MRVIGPNTLTVGQSNTINDPAQGGGNPSAAVQIQNSSPYQLAVLAQGDTLSIQPFTAQTVEISGQPIQVTPLASTSTVTCLVTFVFLLTVEGGQGVMLPDGSWVEAPPQQDGPLTAAAIASALSTQGSVDLLGSGSITLVANTPKIIPVSGAFTALHSYSSLLVFLVNGQDTQCPVVFVGAYNTHGTTVIYESQASPMETRPLSSAPVVNFVLPFASATGDGINVAVTSPVSLNPVTYLVYGLTAPLAVQVTAPLGNPLGVSNRGGSLRASVNVLNTGAAAQILAAPAAGASYALKRLTCNAGVVALGGVTSAFLYGLTSTATTTPGIVPDNLDGLLCTEALQAFTINTTAATVYLFYDLIPTPAIS